MSEKEIRSDLHDVEEHVRSIIEWAKDFKKAEKEIIDQYEKIKIDPLPKKVFELYLSANKLSSSMAKLLPLVNV